MAEVVDNSLRFLTDGPNAKLSTADIVHQMETASQNPGVAARKEGDVAKGLESSAFWPKADIPRPLNPSAR